MSKCLALATVAVGTLLVTACNKPADNAAAPAPEMPMNAMATSSGDAMSSGNAMDSNASGNAMASDDNSTDPHSGSGGH